jgi:hypothetical protein
MDHTSGPPGGWARFVDEFWEQRGARFPGAGGIAGAPELFELLTRAAATPQRHWRLFVDGAHHQLRLDDNLPAPSDGDFSGYMTRASSRFPGAALTLLLHEAQIQSFDIYRRTIQFLDGLYRRKGTCLTAESTVYASRADRTCFGIHQDEYSNFLFMVEGEKRFLLWPASVIERHPELVETLDPGPIRAEATVLEARPGDLLYIPSRTWHLAEADRGVAVHFSLLLNLLDEETHELVTREAAAIARKRIANRQDPMILPSESALPPSLADSVASFSGIDRELRRAIEIAWARRRSAFGYRHVPDLAEVGPFEEGDRIAIDPIAPIVVARDGDRLILFAHGRELPFPAHPRVLELIERLNRGDSISVGELLAAPPARARVGDAEMTLDRRGIAALLRELRAMRAIEKI